MGTSLYIHIPFCESKCRYCAFNSVSGKDNLIDEYVRALSREAQVHHGRKISTVYIGGGTPTYLGKAGLESIFALINKNFVFDANIECTMEANPAQIDLNFARFINGLGVNRVSMGVESMNDAILKFLGRPHNASGSINAFKILREAGFKNINLDMIYAIPGQTLKELDADIKLLRTFESEHLSLYCLSIEKGSILHAEGLTEPSADMQATQYRRICRVLSDTGFNQYEISNFAKKGFECRHNINYWECADYIGIGAGSHSHIQGRRFWNVKEPADYINLMNNSNCALDGEEYIVGLNGLKESVLIGLRMSCGVDISGLEFRFNAKLDSGFNKKLDLFVKNGFLENAQDKIRATSKGRLLLDEICAQLI